MLMWRNTQMLFNDTLKLEYFARRNSRMRKKRKLAPPTQNYFARRRWSYRSRSCFPRRDEHSQFVVVSVHSDGTPPFSKTLEAKSHEQNFCSPWTFAYTVLVFARSDAANWNEFPQGLFRAEENRRQPRFRLFSLSGPWRISKIFLSRKSRKVVRNGNFPVPVFLSRTLKTCRNYKTEVWE